MSDSIMETGSRADRNKCIVEKIITMPGLNLLIIPKKHESCSALNIAMAIADATGFLERKPEHGRALVFSLEDAKKKSEQMIARYNATIGDITVVYAYQKGSFGDRIDEGLDVYLQDNSQTKMIIVDSLEKIIEAEFSRMEYSHAYRKLCAIKNIADRHRAILLVGIHAGDPEDIAVLTEIADTVLKIVTKDERQGNHKYILHANRRSMPEKEIIAEFDANNCTWNQIVAK